MDTSIYKTLRAPLTSITAVGNHSLIELCITELVAGNYRKGIDLSEELIKKDINDSGGWALKALSQAYVFDYGDNIHFLKSSLSSLTEFLERSTASLETKQTIEALFYMNLLDRTVQMVSGHINSANRAKNAAIMEARNAEMADFGAAIGFATAVNSKSTAGKVIGASMLVGGNVASSGYNMNSQLFAQISRGSYGSAVANMTITIAYAQNLKAIVETGNCSAEIQAMASEVLRNWLWASVDLFKKIADNLTEYVDAAIQDGTAQGTKLVSDSMEITQFLALCDVYGFNVDSSGYSAFKSAVNDLMQFNIQELNDIILRSRWTAGLISFSWFPIAYIIAQIQIKEALFMFVVSGILCMLGGGFFTYRVYFFTPHITLLKRFKEEINSFKNLTNNIVINKMNPIK